MTELHDNWANVSSHLFHYKQFVQPSQLNEFAEKLRSIYYNEFPGRNDEETFIRLHEDLNFNRAIHLTATALTKLQAPVYPYKYMFKGKFSLSVLRGSPQFSKLNYGWPPERVPTSLFSILELPFVRPNTCGRIAISLLTFDRIGYALATIGDSLEI